MINTSENQKSVQERRGPHGRLLKGPRPFGGDSLIEAALRDQARRAEEAKLKVRKP